MIATDHSPIRPLSEDASMTIRHLIERIDRAEANRRKAVDDIYDAVYVARVAKFQTAVINHLEALAFHTEATEIRADEAREALMSAMYKPTILPGMKPVGVLPGL